MSGTFTSPNEGNKIVNVPMIASMPTLLFAPCSTFKVNGRQMMVYRLTGGLSVIRPLTESLSLFPQANQTVTSNRPSNLKVVDAKTPLPVSGAWRPGVSVECRSPISMSNPSMVSLTDVNNSEVSKALNLAIEDSRMSLTPIIEDTRQTLNSTTNDKTQFHTTSEDARNPNSPTTDDTRIPFTVSSVWTSAVSVAHVQTGSPCLTSKPSIVSVADLKNCDAGCLVDGENPIPVLCVANANTVLKKQEEPTQSGGHNTLHSGGTVPGILGAKKRKNSDGDIQRLHTNRSTVRPRLTSGLVDKTAGASFEICMLSDRHEKGDHCYANSSSANESDKPKYTHISPEVRLAIINRKLKRTVSDEKDVRTQKESHTTDPVISDLKVNGEKKDERATSVNDMKSPEASTWYVNDEGSFPKHISGISSANGVQLHGKQITKSSSESLVTSNKNYTSFTTITRPAGPSMPRLNYKTNSSTSSIDQQQQVSGNPADGTHLSSSRPKNPIILPRDKPAKVVSCLKIKLPEGLLHNKQMFSSIQMKPISASAFKTATISLDELDDDPAVSFPQGTLNQSEEGRVNSEQRPPVKFKSLLGQCRVVIERLPIKHKNFRTTRWRKHLENKLSRKQRRAFLKRFYDRPYAIRRTPIVSVL